MNTNEHETDEFESVRTPRAVFRAFAEQTLHTVDGSAGPRK